MVVAGSSVVTVATSVPSALEFLDFGIGFAVLDFPPAGSSCTEIATRLRADGVPFIYMSGRADRLVSVT